eukprot:TRINITY_DN2435_c0_g1_i12.p1 TRINITY_DN2435_c0_g1~~TRINITY_DN2435_c0_g1_i12.p1  ORF type:complete len:150 (+),score=26.97 TRINITY_DN2435_c0_g1_i12:451-900(+)
MSICDRGASSVRTTASKTCWMTNESSACLLDPLVLFLCSPGSSGINAEYGGIPMRDFVVACAAGFYDKIPLVDLNFYEDSSGSPDMPVAILPKSGKITMLQMDSKLHVDTFQSVVECAVDGCQRIYEILLSVVRARTQELINSTNAISS